MYGFLKYVIIILASIFGGFAFYLVTGDGSEGLLLIIILAVLGTLYKKSKDEDQ